MQKTNPLTKPMPRVLRVAARKGERGLNNRPLDVVHNHDIRPPHIKYVGFSNKTNDNDHLFVCQQKSDPPRKILHLVTFSSEAFTHDSKAGRGGCSMRLCPGEAVQMSTTSRRQAFCVKCVQRMTGNAPCQWTQIEPCRRKLKINTEPYGKDCPVCLILERDD